MSDAVADPEVKPEKSGKKLPILAVFLALVGGGVGFYAVKAGLIPLGKHAGDSQMNDKSHGTGHSSGQADSHGEAPDPLDDIAFVATDQITISLSPSQGAQHLIFRAQLEVNAEFEREVMSILPRVTDVMNSYLRALELSDLTGPLALVRIRGQMLRRIQVVTGRGRVRDLLIMEFVLN